ncbi:MAG: proton-conducting transporter membrane subunit, partial [Patescibacteria group bacterium]
MSVQLLYTLTLIFFGAGALGAVSLYKTGRYAHYWAHGFVMLASVTGLLSGVSVLKSGVPVQFNLIALKGITIPFIVSIDAFSAVFMMLIAVLTFCASWYGLAYMKHYEGRYSLARFGVWYAIFAASLMGVVSTQSVFTFLWWWEVMSISSYFLVTYDYRNEANIRAGTLYLVMTQIGTACIAVAMLLMALATGALDFASIGSVSASLTGWFPHVVFALFLIGDYLNPTGQAAS